jgi:hypothetical protein
MIDLSWLGLGAARVAAASGVRIERADSLPLHAEVSELATAAADGEDYELLFTAAPAAAVPPTIAGTRAARIGARRPVPPVILDPPASPSTLRHGLIMETPIQRPSTFEPQPAHTIAIGDAPVASGKIGVQPPRRSGGKTFGPRHRPRHELDQTVCAGRSSSSTQYGARDAAGRDAPSRDAYRLHVADDLDTLGWDRVRLDGRRRD